MATKQKRLPKDVFDSIYATVPRLTVEVIVRTAEGIVLTKRSIEPCKGQWHIPGGTVYFGESLSEAVQRVALDELGVTVASGRLLGYIEYPRMQADGYNGWPVGVAFEVHVLDGQLRGSDQGEEIGIFATVPPNTVSEQAAFLEPLTRFKLQLP